MKLTIAPYTPARLKPTSASECFPPHYYPLNFLQINLIKESLNSFLDNVRKITREHLRHERTCYVGQ